MNIGRLHEVMRDVEKERQRQDSKWGDQDWTDLGWNAITGEEVGEAAKEVIELSFSSDPKYYDSRLDMLRVELVQCAAVAVAWIEAIDRRLLDGVIAISPDEKFGAIRKERRAEIAALRAASEQTPF